MSGLSQIDPSQMTSVVTSKLAPIAESLNQCFDTSFTLECGVSQPVGSASPGMDLLQPGLIVTIRVGDEFLLCAVPEALPLPEWYTQPDTSQQARLDTLAMEWSLNCLPDEQPGEEYFCDVVPALWDTLQQCQPHPTAKWLPLTPMDDQGPAEGIVWILWPTATSPRRLAESAKPVAAGNDESDSDRALRLSRLMNVPVPVIVKLAEKKIELGQLMAMGPGTIVMFEKSCEDLLDLHVNNQLYCRGEAVKIGEKFGIKINEVGSIEERVSAVMGLGN